MINWAATKVDVEAGATANWELSKEFTAPADTRCVLRGVGGAKP